MSIFEISTCDQQCKVSGASVIAVVGELNQSMFCNQVPEDRGGTWTMPDSSSSPGGLSVDVGEEVELICDADASLAGGPSNVMTCKATGMLSCLFARCRTR